MDRHDEKERLRERRLESEEREAAGDHRRLVVAYVSAAVLGAAVVIAIAIAIIQGGDAEATGSAHISVQSGSTNGVEPDTRQGPEPPSPIEGDLEKVASSAGCELKEDLPGEGNAHLPPSAPTPNYKTNPPTSGPHAAPPYQQADGAYLEAPDQINVVHSLEHGRIAIQYSPDLSEEEQLDLKGLYETLYAGALLLPNPQMPHDVAVTSWRNSLTCDGYDGADTLLAVRAFGMSKFGETAPEPADAFPLAVGPTPAQPN